MWVSLQFQKYRIGKFMWKWILSTWYLPVWMMWYFLMVQLIPLAWGKISSKEKCIFSCWVSLWSLLHWCRARIVLLKLIELLQSCAVVEISLWSCILKHLSSYKSRVSHFMQNKLIKVLLVTKELKNKRAELQPRQFLYLRIYFFSVSAPSSFFVGLFFFAFTI